MQRSFHGLSADRRLILKIVLNLIQKNKCLLLYVKKRLVFLHRGMTRDVSTELWMRNHLIGRKMARKMFTSDTKKNHEAIANLDQRLPLQSEHSCKYVSPNDYRKFFTPHHSGIDTRSTTRVSPGNLHAWSKKIQVLADSGCTYKAWISGYSEIWWFAIKREHNAKITAGHGR